MVSQDLDSVKNCILWQNHTVPCGDLLNQNNKMKAQVIPLYLICSMVSVIVYGQNAVRSDSYFTNSIIHATAIADGQSVLHRVAKAAKLDGMLDNEGPFTVFAPSDLAFDALPKSLMQKWLTPGNKKQVSALVSYHIIAGEFTAARILQELCRGEGTTTFTTLQGEVITASMDGIDIVLTDSHGNRARIIKADSNQCNGVVHVIDSVIRPRRL